MDTWVTVALTVFYCGWLVAALWLLWRIYRATTRSITRLTDSLITSVSTSRNEAARAARTVEEVARQLVRHLPPSYAECDDVEENLDADAP